jgi:hypothetical protein
MQDKQRIWGFFAHTSIIVGMMFIVFFVIDQFNPAMEFLTSSLSKWLIFFLAVCALFTGLFSAVFLFQKQKRRDEKRSHPQARQTYEHERVPQERFAQPSYDPRAYPQGQQPKGAVSHVGNQPAQLRPANGYPQAYSGYSGEQPKSNYECRGTLNR